MATTTTTKKRAAKKPDVADVVKAELIRLGLYREGDPPGAYEDALMALVARSRTAVGPGPSHPPKPLPSIDPGPLAAERTEVLLGDAVAVVRINGKSFELSPADVDQFAVQLTFARLALN